MSNPDYVLTASLVLDAHHAAVDEDPDEVTGTCAVCGYADGWCDDGWGHFTWASVDEAWDWAEANRV